MLYIFRCCNTKWLSAFYRKRNKRVTSSSKSVPLLLIGRTQTTSRQLASTNKSQQKFASVSGWYPTAFRRNTMQVLKRPITSINFSGRTLRRKVATRVCHTPSRQRHLWVFLTKSYNNVAVPSNSRLEGYVSPDRPTKGSSVSSSKLHASFPQPPTIQQERAHIKIDMFSPALSFHVKRDRPCDATGKEGATTNALRWGNIRAC